MPEDHGRAPYMKMLVRKGHLGRCRPILTAAHPANDGGGGVDVDENHRRGHRVALAEGVDQPDVGRPAGRIPCQRGGGARLYRSAPSE